MNEDTALEYWVANIPVRLTFLFGLTGYAWLFSENGMIGSKLSGKANAGELLQNGLVFSFGFIEIAAWFWVCNAADSISGYAANLALRRTPACGRRGAREP